MTTELDALKEKVARCRRLALSIHESQTRINLMKLAEEFDRHAAAIRDDLRRNIASDPPDQHQSDGEG